MLPKEQINQIKDQLIQQIDSTFPEDKKESTKQQINSMDDEQLEEFLKQNKLINQEDSQSSQQQCIFCSIVSEKVQSYKIDENKDSIAILEINPISKGHALIIPKEHISTSGKIPQSAFSLAKKISKKLKTKFKPKDVIISSSSLFGHEIINVLPIYKDETLNSEKHKAKQEDLEKLQKQLEKKQKPKTVKKQKTEEITENNLWLPKRIP